MTLWTKEVFSRPLICVGRRCHGYRVDVELHRFEVKVAYRESVGAPGVYASRYGVERERVIEHYRVETYVDPRRREIEILVPTRWGEGIDVLNKLVQLALQAEPRE